jgi:adenylate cyclase
MATEIERKFLVAHDGWRTRCVRKEHLRDGLISYTPQRKVRVRIRDDRRATLTIKAKTGEIRNAEFEYEIPIADAEELLASHCGQYVLHKTRHYIPHDGFMWEVDVYEGVLEGVVLAEVEVAGEDVQVPLPDRRRGHGPTRIQEDQHAEGTTRGTQFAGDALTGRNLARLPWIPIRYCRRHNSMLNNFFNSSSSGMIVSTSGAIGTTVITTS